MEREDFGWSNHPNVSKAPCRNGTVVHYDGSNQGLAKKPHSACVTYWKNTRKFHMGPARNWSDLGYAWGVCPHGWVVEGRGFGYAAAAQPGGNTTWTSVTFMSGSDEKPTEAAIKAYRELRSHLRGKGMKSGERKHKSFISTSCPGSILAKMVDKGTLRGGATSPPPPKRPGTRAPAFPLT